MLNYRDEKYFPEFDKYLVQIFPPEGYYPGMIRPDTKRNQQVLGLIKANFKRYELWPYATFEDRIKDTIHPFIVKRCMAVLWAHGLLEKWVEGEWTPAVKKARMAPKRRVEVEAGEGTKKVGHWYGVHYRWI